MLTGDEWKTISDSEDRHIFSQKKEKIVSAAVNGHKEIWPKKLKHLNGQALQRKIAYNLSLPG